MLFMPWLPGEKVLDVEPGRNLDSPLDMCSSEYEVGATQEEGRHEGKEREGIGDSRPPGLNNVY